MNERPKLLGDRYEVGGLLGHGGMAEVYLGHDRRLGRSVAIKVLKPELSRDGTFLARFQQEAQSAAGLNHPSIVSVYDTGEGEVVDTAGDTLPVPYIIMEYVEGQTLREIIHHDGGLPVRECNEIMTGVLSALDYSHRMGIVHRDIKPANIMLTKDGTVKVMDFGIARAMDNSGASMTQTQAIVGTANYFSPEQAKGEHVDARSDLYSAACVLFELMTGRAPFVGDSPIAVAYQHVREQPLPPSEFNVNVPESIDRVLLKGLAKHRDDRYSSAREFALDLRAAVQGQTVGAPLVARDDLATTATQAIPEALMGTQVTAKPLFDDANPATARAGSGAVGGSAAGAAAGLAAGVAAGRNSGRGPTFTDLVTRPETGTVPEVAAEPTRKNRAARAILLVAFMVLAAAALIWGYSKGALPFQTQTVAVSAYNAAAPETAGVVKARLIADGLKVTQVDLPSETVTSGNVISLQPGSGAVVTVGSTVTMTVSSGPPPPVTVAVPDIAGKSLADARTALNGEKLQLGVVTFEDSASVDPGNVIRTDPTSGTAVKQGDSVAVVVASGNAKLPDVRQLPQAEAEKKLTDAGFVPKAVTQETGAAQAGVVVQQQPDQDTSLPRGATVTITVAIAPTQALLKDYTGQDGTAVQNELVTLGLKPVLVPTSSDTVVSGKVIGTDPGGGNTLKVGAQVVVKVSSGPARVTLKNYQGLAPGDVVTELKSLGLNPQVVSVSEYDASVPQGTVRRTDPVAGSAVPIGGAVNVFVSAGPEPKVAIANYAGTAEADAVAALKAAGLNPKVVKGPSANQPTGRVVSTNPVSGTQVSRGSDVTVNVSTGPPVVSATPAPS